MGKSNGGAFLPKADYATTGDWTFDGAVTFNGTVSDTGTTLASPAITGTVTGGATYTAPVLTTPTLGVATATTVNKVTITAPATGSTLTIVEGGSLITAGAYATTLTSTAATGVTLPTTGTLATLAGTEALTNKTVTAPVLGGTVTGTYTLGGTPTLASAAGVPYAAGVAAGYKVARVSMALDGSNPTPWATGLTTVIAAHVNLVGSAAPGVGTSVLTTLINGTSVDVYAWKVTSNADPTLVASTGTETFYGVAIGT